MMIRYIGLYELREPKEAFSVQEPRKLPKLSRLKKFMMSTFIVVIASFILYYSLSTKAITQGISTTSTMAKLIFTQNKDSNIKQTISTTSTMAKRISTRNKDSKNYIKQTISTTSTMAKPISTQYKDSNIKQAISTTSTMAKPISTQNKDSNIKQTISTTSTMQAKPISTQSKDSNIVQELCPEKSSSLLGPLYVDSKVPKMEDVEKVMSSDFNGWVDKGGCWKPTECKARIKMALIIPYRNRYEQLSIFVRHMHPMLKRQNLDYRIIVVEQAGVTIFNRAILLNIGFKEALKLDQYDCFIFHDVDLIPEDDRNEYSCPASPRHLSVAVDKFNYRLPFSYFFGGAESFTREHFELINGFSNKFWGWGGEDDDLYNRISAKNLELSRPPMILGRYKMLKIFHHSERPDPDRFAKLRDSAQRMGNDGLNTLKYSVVNLTEHHLYTLISVDVTEAMPNLDLPKVDSLDRRSRDK